MFYVNIKYATIIFKSRIQIKKLPFVKDNIPSKNIKNMNQKSLIIYDILIDSTVVLRRNHKEFKGKANDSYLPISIYINPIFSTHIVNWS